MNLPDVSTYTPFANRPQMPQLVAPTLQQFGPRMQIDKVRGYEGAMAFNMGPDSSHLALDEDLDVLWMIMTDSAGNKVLVEGRYIGDKYDPPKPVTMEDLMAEMREMKDKLKRLEGGEKHEYSAQSDGQIQSDGKCAQPG